MLLEMNYPKRLYSLAVFFLKKISSSIPTFISSFMFTIGFALITFSLLVYLQLFQYKFFDILIKSSKQSLRVLQSGALPCFFLNIYSSTLLMNCFWFFVCFSCLDIYFWKYYNVVPIRQRWASKIIRPAEIDEGSTYPTFYLDSETLLELISYFILFSYQIFGPSPSPQPPPYAFP